MDTLSSSNPIIIDTDCGIDDAIALLLALSNKDKASLIGITCCFGNTSIDNVVSNVMRVLTVCNEKIPVYKGSSGPLIKHHLPCSNDDPVHGDDGFGNESKNFPTGGLEIDAVPAAFALTESARKASKRITLIAIGPLTNLAIAHRIDPTFTENLKSIVIMGGNYKGVGNVTEVAEFNFHCDPEAANIILTESKCPVVLVPWETTLEYGIKWDLYIELINFKTPKGHIFKQITKNFRNRCLKKGREKYLDCDFLAVVAVLFPECVKSTFKSHLHVDCESNLTRGLTVLMRDSSQSDIKTQVEIITDYDIDFLDSVRKQMLS